MILSRRVTHRSAYKRVECTTVHIVVPRKRPLQNYYWYLQGAHEQIIVWYLSSKSVAERVNHLFYVVSSCADCEATSVMWFLGHQIAIFLWCLRPLHPNLLCSDLGDVVKLSILVIIFLVTGNTLLCGWIFETITIIIKHVLSRKYVLNIFSESEAFASGSLNVSSLVLVISDCIWLYGSCHVSSSL